MNSGTGNKFAIMNTILKNKLLKYSKLTQQIEAFNKLKQFSYLGLFFIYAESLKLKPIRQSFYNDFYRRVAYSLLLFYNKLVY